MSKLAVDIDQLQRLFATHQEIDRDPLAHHGDKPLTIVAVGLTASGKTSLLNLFLGSRLLAEGMGHTTMVPNAIIRGDTFQAQPLDIDGEPLPDFPAFPEAPTQLPSLPSSEAEWIDRLITNNRLPFGKQQKAWWDEVSQAAQEGRCSMVRITAPIDWLPPDVRIIEVPGYETWQENSDHPDERSAKLKGVVLSWFKRADHAIFVSGHDEFLKGNGPEFIREFLGSSRTGTSLIINKIDQAAAMDYDTTVARITERHYALLDKAKINGKNIRIFPVCAHPRSLNPLSDTLRADIIASLERLTGSLNATITDIRHLHSLDRDKEREDALAELYRKCREEMAACRNALKEKIVSDEMAGHAKWAAENAVNNLDISIGDAIDLQRNGENAGIAKGCKHDVKHAVAGAIQGHMQPHITSYQEDLKQRIQKLFTEADPKLVAKLDLGNGVTGVDLSGNDLNLAIAGVLASVIGAITASFFLTTTVTSTSWIFFTVTTTVIAPIGFTALILAIAAGIVIALLAPGFITNRIRNQLRDGAAKNINRDSMKKMWDDGMHHALITAEIEIWTGIEYHLRKLHTGEEGSKVYSNKDIRIISTHSRLPISSVMGDNNERRLISGEKRDDDSNQRWHLSNVEDCVYISIHDQSDDTDYAIDINQSEPDDGTAVTLSPMETWKENQRWIFSDISDGKGAIWKIIHVHSGKVLDLKDLDKEPGTTIQIWDWAGNDEPHENPNPNQRWFISATMARKDVTW